MNDGKICVIIPANNSTPHIINCLESVLATAYHNFEVYFIDDGLAKEAKDLLAVYRGRIKIIESKQRGPSFARNLAARSTDAQFLAFTDSDCLVDKNWLQELLKGFYKFPEAVSAGGAQGLPYDATPFERKVFIFMKKAGIVADYMRKASTDSIRIVGHNPSCNVMYRRDIFLKEGGFLEGLWPGEDVELDHRLIKKGYKLLFNPKAVVYHYRPKRLIPFLCSMYRYGDSCGFLTRRYGIFRKIQLVPFILACLSIVFFLCIFFKSVLLPSILAFLTLFFIFAFFKFNITVFIIGLLGTSSWLIGFLIAIVRNKKFH